MGVVVVVLADYILALGGNISLFQTEDMIFFCLTCFFEHPAL